VEVKSNRPIKHDHQDMNRKGQREKKKAKHIPDETVSKEAIQLRVNCKHTIDTLRKKMTMCHCIFVYGPVNVIETKR
jgi:3-phosphoglycerate kinase